MRMRRSFAKLVSAPLDQCSARPTDRLKTPTPGARRCRSRSAATAAACVAGARIIYILHIAGRDGDLWCTHMTARKNIYVCAGLQQRRLNACRPTSRARMLEATATRRRLSSAPTAPTASSPPLVAALAPRARPIGPTAPNCIVAGPAS
eukprot:SAG31_NODE_2543_length_5534_cov_9.026311_5_plen_149_part_00